MLVHRRIDPDCSAPTQLDLRPFHSAGGSPTERTRSDASILHCGRCDFIHECGLRHGEGHGQIGCLHSNQPFGVRDRLALVLLCGLQPRPGHRRTAVRRGSGAICERNRLCCGSLLDRLGGFVPRGERQKRKDNGEKCGKLPHRPEIRCCLGSAGLS